MAGTVAADILEEHRVFQLAHLLVIDTCLERST